MFVFYLYVHVIMMFCAYEFNCVDVWNEYRNKNAYKAWLFWVYKEIEMITVINYCLRLVPVGAFFAPYDRLHMTANKGRPVLIGSPNQFCP